MEFSKWKEPYQVATSKVQNTPNEWKTTLLLYSRLSTGIFSCTNVGLKHTIHDFNLISTILSYK